MLEAVPHTLVDKTYIKIRNDITENILKPGEKINNAMLCERYNVSVTPIKQALNRLVAEGLVESIPRKGMKVKRATWAEIDEILEIRLMLEKYFINQVILALDSNIRLREQFEQNIKEHREYVEKFSDVAEYFTTYKLDQQFHALYLKCSGNKKALNLFESLNSHSYATYLYGKQPREKTLMGVQEHQMIYEALIAKDEKRALEVIELHNKNAKEIIYLMLKIGNNI